MKQKDEIKLEALSMIDDDIVEKNTQKRVRLMNKKRAPRWVLPSSVAAVILVAIMVPILILLFAKQVPVYEGMTVSKNKINTVENTAPAQDVHRFDFLSNTNGNNGNHAGHNKKPIDEIIEGDPSIGIDVPEQPIYYANLSEDIYITVHISNPDSFEILSFTLNDQKYSSYMFEDGSDMENLILKVNVGNIPGIVEFTIDAIKYVDGTEIKDVDMRGERTVKVGVYSEGIQPKVNIEQPSAGFASFSTKISITDKLGLIQRNNGAAYAIVCDNENLIDVKEIDNYDGFEYSFDALEPGVQYRFAVVAIYDSFDGAGMSVHTLYEEEFSTQAMLEITSLESSVYGINGQYVFEKADDITASDVKVELYRDNELIKTTYGASFEFTELEDYTDYTVKVSVDYDLSDGEGMRNITLERQIKTKPYIVAESCKVLNTSAVHEGDSIYLKISVDNPNEVVITSVNINGISCPIIGDSTGSSLNIELVNNGQFGAGYTNLVLEAINTDGYSVTVQEGLSDELFIYGDFSIESVCFVNSNFEETRWAFPSQEIFVMVTLNNPTGYDVISINGNTDIKKLDDEHYYFSEPSPSSEEWTIIGNWTHDICIDKIEYRDPLNENGDHISLELEGGIKAYLMAVNSDKKKYVSSASELMNISGDYYYELTNDIDLDGVNWKPIEDFYGVLNGNGYTIKNLSIVGTSTLDYIGLFGKLNGGVENINFTGVNIIVNRVNAHCGIICGMLGDQHHWRGAFIKNCSVDATCSIVANADYDTFVNTEYSVGGLVGYIDMGGTIMNCVNSASVLGNAEQVGGIAGGANHNSSVVDCENDGTVKGFLYVGGIAGSAYGSVSKCENRGTVSGGTRVGGIAGIAASDITDCKNSGAVNGIEVSFGPDDRSGSSIGGIAGSMDGNITVGKTASISNCENIGDVTGYNQVGGIVGYTSGKTEKCINSGAISGCFTVGGIVGDSYLSITDCIDNGEVTIIP